jgi:soluble lytic murein transglycosylase
LLKDGKKDAAKPLLDKLAAANEDDYYGIRAVSLLGNKQNLPKATRESKVDLTTPLDYASAETWLAARTGRAVTDPGWSSDNRWLRAQELWLVGRTSQGDSEVFDLIESYSRDPIAMYTLARSLQSQGRIGMSGRAGQRLLRTLNANPNEGLPKALLSLSYPPAFGGLAQKYAQSERISPLLLLAFVRQESFFDPRAESPAGALGLTQVLPSTGKATADKLGVSGTDPEDFLEADLNLRVGARYMADQLGRFNNEIFVAFAAYNAGPNGAQRWRKTSGEDADVFLETIEFRETRLYVELVAENYAIYRYIYGGESVPNLPD